jgi:hypothetical protein
MEFFYGAKLSSKFKFNASHPTVATHFSPHEFRIITKGGCETIIHGIRCTLNLHLNSILI